MAAIRHVLTTLPRDALDYGTWPPALVIGFARLPPHRITQAVRELAAMIDRPNVKTNN